MTGRFFGVGRLAAEGFQTPIDEIDAASRILDPVVVGLVEPAESRQLHYGAFFKECAARVCPDLVVSSQVRSIFAICSSIELNVVMLNVAATSLPSGSKGAHCLRSNKHDSLHNHSTVDD